MSEGGFKVPALDGRFGVLGPAGLQREIVNRLQQAVVQTIRAPEVRQRFDLLGYDTIGDTPEQYAQAIRNDLEVFGKLIREARIKPE
jgi:tripartite-type tricarboxylate transporter receptor subunit TctC